MMIDKRLLNTVPSAKKFVAAAVALQIASLLCRTALIFAAARLLASRGGEWQIPALVIVLCAAAIFALNIASSLAVYRTSRDVKSVLRAKIYEKLLRLGTAYEEKTTTAKIVQLAVEGAETLETWFGAFLPQFYYSMAAAVITFAVLAFLNLKMAVVLLLCVPLIPISMAVVQGIAKKLLGKYWAQYASLADNFLENLQGLTTLQIYQADGYKAAQMAKEAENFRRVTMKVLSMQLNSIIIMDIVAYGGAAAGIVCALGAFYAGAMTAESAFVCILLSADIFALLDEKEYAFGNESVSEKDYRVKPDNDSTVRDNDRVVFETSALGYEFDRNVLHGFDFALAEGECAAFAGKSGSGKSTAAKILSGIYPAYTGSAKICGKEIRDISRESLYAFVSYISHRDWIFAGTVRDCLCEGKSDADDAEMWRALDAVRLSDFLRENGGLEAKIDEGGGNLSGGQRQRLSIARALLRDSIVYIFDEATSNIDTESEQAILSLIAAMKGKKTIIMISHRTENCKIADKIYHFENGGVSL